MQRLFKILFVSIIALYGSAQAFSTNLDDNFFGAQAAPVPHIALLLPLQSSSFGSAAEIVKQGFVAATMRETALPWTIRIYPTTDDPLDILISYREALYAGAIMVVGPLTRDGVSAVASSHFVTVPTLALNVPDGASALPSNLYLFGLQMENEARQIAELVAMTQINKRHAIIINTNNALSLRLQTSFVDWWLEHGRNTTAESVHFDGNQAALGALRKYTGGNDKVVFLALGAEKARLIRPFLHPSTPVYATSQVFIGNNDPLFNHDLNGVRFLDVPWLLQSDHPAVMAYERLNTFTSTGEERLYALGIDAFRLMTLMFHAQTASEIAFDGVTGYIYFAPPNKFVRRPVAAVFSGGKVLPLDLLLHER